MVVAREVTLIIKSEKTMGVRYYYYNYYYYYYYYYYPKIITPMLSPSLRNLPSSSSCC